MVHNLSHQNTYVLPKYRISKFDRYVILKKIQQLNKFNCTLTIFHITTKRCTLIRNYHFGKIISFLNVGQLYIEQNSPKMKFVSMVIYFLEYYFFPTKCWGWTKSKTYLKQKLLLFVYNNLTNTLLLYSKLLTLKLTILL